MTGSYTVEGTQGYDTEVWIAFLMKDGRGLWIILWRGIPWKDSKREVGACNQIYGKWHWKVGNKRMQGGGWKANTVKTSHETINSRFAFTNGS